MGWIILKEKLGYMKDEMTQRNSLKGWSWATFDTINKTTLPLHFAGVHRKIYPLLLHRSKASPRFYSNLHPIHLATLSSSACLTQALIMCPSLYGTSRGKQVCPDLCTGVLKVVCTKHISHNASYNTDFWAQALVPLLGSGVGPGSQQSFNKHVGLFW